MRSEICIGKGCKGQEKSLETEEEGAPHRRRTPAASSCGGRVVGAVEMGDFWWRHGRASGVA
jgi:hypothetical protein